MRKERPGHTLQTTALLNEAYLRLIDQTKVDWRDPAHVFGIAARIMHQILVDHAHGARRENWGGDVRSAPMKARFTSSFAPRMFPVNSEAGQRRAPAV